MWCNSSGIIALQCRNAGRVQIKDAFFIALADDTDAIIIDIRQIQPDQLTAADTAV